MLFTFTKETLNLKLCVLCSDISVYFPESEITNSYLFSHVYCVAVCIFPSRHLLAQS